ncbi:Hypothetical protein CAP_1233 [Chondromyces apiculatus DSM 436]|uniref:Uncharacterized protein n=2 Tax=Chondromyces apiculatus TaxID=51 RepID=A0A017TCJ9_9BACT|nr:Hypothetical protein CAP_1233 [Chondromyces apiculatus DSM 436]
MALTDDDVDTPAPAVAVDSAGNVFVAGTFRGELRGDGELLMTSLGERDAYVLKLGPTGGLLWTARLGGPGDQRIYGVAVDAAEGVFITGEYKGELAFGSEVLSSPETTNMFVARLDASGAPLCAREHGDADGDQFGIDVAAVGNGAVVVGMYFGTIELGGTTYGNAGDRDTFIARFDAQCEVVWSHAYGSTGADFGWSVAATAGGRVALGMDSPGTLDLGGGELPGDDTDDDALLASLGPSGEYLWGKRLGDGDSQWAPRVSFDLAGNVLAAGSLWGQMDLGVDVLTSAGGPDVYVLKIDGAGTPLWGRRYGDGLEQHAFKTAVDASGAVLVTGGMQGTVDFGGGSRASAGNMDLFVLKLDGDGQHLWSLHAGDAAEQVGTGLAVAGSGAAVVSGYFSGTMDLGKQLVSTSGVDGFVARLAP